MPEVRVEKPMKLQRSKPIFSSRVMSKKTLAKTVARTPSSGSELLDSAITFLSPEVKAKPQFVFQLFNENKSSDSI